MGQARKASANRAKRGVQGGGGRRAVANAGARIDQAPEYRRANDWTRIRLARAWRTEGWQSLVKQLKQQIIPVCD